MNEELIITALLFGICLGAVYFGGLWITVELLPAFQRLTLVIVVSYLIRITLTMAGFYYILVIDWKQFVSCAIGFILVRQLIMRRVRSGGDAEKKDDDNA
jgi:F1F0 ATPase subunit 2